MSYIRRVQCDNPTCCNVFRVDSYDYVSIRGSIYLGDDYPIFDGFELDEDDSIKNVHERHYCIKCFEKILRKEIEI